MDSRFEIRIFANIAGASEINFGNSTNLSQNIINNDILDAKRGVFSPGTFIVFYGREAYVYAKLIVSPKEAGYRDSQVYVCLAVKRNYRLKGAKSVLDNLGNEFYRLASEARSDVARALHNNQKRLEEIVENDIVEDIDQPLYPLSNQQAVVSYEGEEELEDLLSYPIRPEFSNISVLYILQKEEAVQKWQELKPYIKAITGVRYPYQRTYKLHYPDGTEEDIAGLEQEVNRKCIKKYHNPLELKGKLLDRIEDWNITLNEEKTVYTIGLRFEPEERVYDIECRDVFGKDCSQVRFSIISGRGKIENNGLKVVGSEIADVEDIKLRIENPEWKIKEQKVCENKIIIIVNKVNHYDVAYLWEKVAGCVGGGKGVEIELVDKNKNVLYKFSPRSLSKYLDVPYSSVFYRVKAEKYKDCYLKINDDGQPECGDLGLEKYPQEPSEGMVNVIFEINNPEFKRSGGTVLLTIKKYPDEEKYEKIRIRRSGIEKKLQDGRYGFTIEAEGYKPFTVVEKDYRNKREEVIPVHLKKRINIHHIAILVLLAIVMFGGGFLTSSLLFKGGGQDSKGQDAQLQALVDSLEYRVEELQVSNNNLIGENKALHESIAKLQEPSKTEEQPQSIGRERKDARREREKDKEEREALVAKLRGISFTQEDINKLEGMGPLTEEERELLTSCRNCFRLLNVAINTKDKNDKQHAAEQIENRKGWFYENLYRVLIEEHKAVMEKIIIGEYASMYKVDITQDYKSIKDAIDDYDDDQY